MSGWQVELLIAVVKVLVIFHGLLILFSLMTYLERRLLAFMQFRLGPNRTGPAGILQPLADGIKLFFKEELIPEGANKWLFVAAPAVLLLDEPSLGLSPTVTQTVFDALAAIRDRGIAVLLVEQRAQRTVALANRTLVLANGEVRLTLTPDDAGDTDRMIHAYLS